MADTEAADRRSEDSDWKTRHARIGPRASEGAKIRLVELPDSVDDDWALRHAETKRDA